MTESTDQKLVLTRILNAPIEKVWSAWTDPAQLSRWHRPNERWAAVNADIDLRIGGAYLIAMTHSDGDVFTMSGVYKVIQPPNQLVFTWKPGTPTVPVEQASETVVSISLEKSAGGTSLTLVHEGFKPGETLDPYIAGWNGILDSLVNEYSAAK